MDFGCAIGELDTIWAFPEESTDADSSYSPDRSGAPGAGGGGATVSASTASGASGSTGIVKAEAEEDPTSTGGEPWLDLPFEFSIPSPEYDISGTQRFDTSAFDAIEASINASIEASQASADASIDTSFDDTMDSFQDLSMPSGSPYMSQTESLDLMSPEYSYMSGVSDISGMSSMPNMPSTSSQIMMQRPQPGPMPTSSMCHHLEEHQQQQQLQHYDLDMNQLDDANPHYVRNHPIPPQQQQNWRSFARRQSISKMPLAQLYQIMGLPHNHSSAKDREERIMNELQKSGFKIGQQTWIRDTEEPFRRNVVERIYQQTKDEYGYSKHLLEAIIRRGTYARMQSNLRRKRRHMSRMRRRGLMQ